MKIFKTRPRIVKLEIDTTEEQVPRIQGPKTSSEYSTESQRHEMYEEAWSITYELQKHLMKSPKGE
jgi:hypothetical protein